ncbi:MAG: tRNA (adenosine(37)-N6)-threonylcarbamoyltransferase complex transferase subunit TsaD, partial [Candidatus Omnitrophota bacterium]|nr:tRNA (adenosine(37)-N6)-threonylcarbamoyltransferase complex transferase subunit TsaD [Candidatus Omnitrophota bacterium]
VTNGPGLVGALLIGISMAKSISYSLSLPLIGVNHILAHLYSSFLSADKPEFPFIGLVVSGGHTTLFYCEDIGLQRILGSTRDDAVGEAYDKVAKILGLGYPGGPVIDRLARRARPGTKISFPKSYLGKDSLDFSFSGIKTAVLYYVNKQKGSGFRVQDSVINEICYSFQEAALDALVDNVIKAASLTGSRRVVLGGGVAANSRLREKMRELSVNYAMKIHFPELKYCMDNAAMIGCLGEALYKKGARSDLRLSAEPNLEMTNVK